ncbi:flagellar filament capping protein FliD [Paracoccaceae bacterium]|nr:flagellar filament capping protein FliD [Paracoccaceae bacterium]
MVEAARPDYLSLVNKGGSGLNISELVTSIVAAEIEPKKAIHSDKKNKSDNAISGIGFLNAQTSLSKLAFDARKSDSYFSISSSNTSLVDFSSTDEMKLVPAQTEISNVTLAKKMVFELPGFTDLTSTINQAISVDFGSWSSTSTASSSASNTVEAGKTYKVTTRADGVSGDSFDEYTRDPNDPSDADAFHGTPIEVDDVFRASQAFTNSNYTFTEVDAYAFTAKSGNTTTNLTLSGTVQNVVKQLNGINGFSAKFVQTSSSGTPTYSIVLTSDNTGATNGFKISAGGTTRWETTGAPTTNTNLNNFSQLSRDASLKVNNVSITRSSNAITDVLDGITVNLKADTTSAVQLNVVRSKTETKTSVENVVKSLNEFKAEIDRLTYIDIDGDNNGPLAMDPAVTRVKSSFKRISAEILSGYGDSPIYLSHLGIKTNNNGEYYFDNATFDRTWSANPEFFNALKDNNVSSNSSTATVTKSQFTKIPAGSYTIQNDAGQWKFGSTNLNRIDYNGGSRFTSTSYAGLVIDTAESAPSSFKVYIGKNFSEKISEFMAAILESSSSVSAAKTAYTTNSSDISLKLKDLEKREELITTRYTNQFGSMEQAMSQFNSTKSLLENFMESWKKQK